MLGAIIGDINGSCFDLMESPTFSCLLKKAVHKWVIMRVTQLFDMIYHSGGN